MAARGTGAAGRPNAAHRRARGARRKRSGGEEAGLCFTQTLADSGWTDRNVRLDLHWAGDDSNRIRAFAQELVGLQPDIILTNTTTPIVALQRETRTIPIVFASLGDPVAS